MYYRDAHAALVVYDITEMSSWQKALNWVRELQMKGDPDVVIVLVGNKKDLEEMRVVGREVFIYLERLCYDMIGFFGGGCICFLVVDIFWFLFF